MLTIFFEIFKKKYYRKRESEKWQWRKRSKMRNQEINILNCHFDVYMYTSQTINI